MLFKNKKCSRCSRSYEEVLDECPYCSEPNKDYEGLGIPKKLIMFPLLVQLAYFGIGFGALFVFMILFSVIFSNAMGSKNPLAYLLSNIIPYIIIFIALAILLVFYRKKIIKFIRKPYDFLIGLAFGAVIIGINFLYSNVLLPLFIKEANTNQTTFEIIAANYPIISILIFGFVAPIVEEITYRLGLFTAGYRVNKYFAYVLVIVIFGLIHFDFAGDLKVEFLSLPNYLIAGLLFCLAYRFGGLPGCVTAHVLNNVFSTIFTILYIKYGH